MNPARRFKVGIFGSADGPEVESLKKHAYYLGNKIAVKGGILCTGACPGLPHFAAEGAFAISGTVLGFSPAMNFDEHVNKYRFPHEHYTLVFTGMEKKGRNIVNIRSCDAGIFIAGRIGTINEFTIMYDEGDGKIIGLVSGSGGAVDGQIIPLIRSIEKKSKAQIIIESDMWTLVERVFNYLESINKS